MIKLNYAAEFSDMPPSNRCPVLFVFPLLTLKLADVCVCMYVCMYVLTSLVLTGQPSEKLVLSHKYAGAERAVYNEASPGRSCEFASITDREKREARPRKHAPFHCGVRYVLSDCIIVWREYCARDCSVPSPK